MTDHTPHTSNDEDDDWFPDKFIENLGAFALGALVIAAMLSGGLKIGLVVLAFIIGISFGGRIGTGMVGAALGYLLGGSVIGMGIGIAIGVFNAWVYEIESHRRGSTVVKQLGWIDGFLIGILMAGQAGTSGVQLLLAIAVYTFIGGFTAEVVPGFLRFVASLDEEPEEETA